MRYVRARIAQDEEELTYRVYVTDSFKLIGQISRRWYDMIAGETPDERSGDEIALDVIRRLGISMRGGGK